MSINPYFNTNKHKASQDLIEDLTIESIKIHGLEVYYIPREIVKEDSIFGEDVLSKFTEAFSIEAYLDSIDQWGGEGEVLSKFGIQSKDSMDLVISKKRFLQGVAPKSNLSLTRPKEGDLIYVPMTKTMFEINFVEHENPFYQAGKLYTYKLTCELFRYSYENIATGNSEIDNVTTPVDSDGEDLQQFALDLTLTTGSLGNALDYKLGETVYVGSSLSEATVTGNVIEWTEGLSTSVLRVNQLTGTLSVDDYIIGDTSGTKKQYQSQITTTVHIDSPIVNDVVDNDDLQDEANEFLDFSEYNPFSEGDF
jgi:hypothetical protein